MTTCCYFKIVLCNWINEIIVEDSSFAWTCHGAKNRWKTHGYYCKPLLIETPVNEWEQWRHDSNTSSSRLWATVTRQQHDNNTAAAHWLIEWLIMTLGWLIIKPRTDPKNKNLDPGPFEIQEPPPPNVDLSRSNWRCRTASGNCALPFSKVCAFCWLQSENQQSEI